MGGDNTCVIGPLAGFFGLRSASGLQWEEGGCFVYLSAPGSTTATSVISRLSGWVHVRSALILPPEAVFPTTVSMVTGPGWVWRISAARAWTTRWGRRVRMAPFRRQLRAWNGFRPVL